MLRTDAKFPNRRTYVVKLARDATPEMLRGRLENLVTLEHAEFVSAVELCALLARDVERIDSPQNGF